MFLTAVRELLDPLDQPLVTGLTRTVSLGREPCTGASMAGSDRLRSRSAATVHPTPTKAASGAQEGVVFIPIRRLPLARKWQTAHCL